MARFFLLSLFILGNTSVASDAVTITSENFNFFQFLSNPDQVMSPVLYCGESFKQVEVRACSNEKVSKIVGRLQDAYLGVLRAQKKINTYFKKDQVLKDDLLLKSLKDIEKKFTCISRKLNDLKIWCDDRLNFLDKFLYCRNVTANAVGSTVTTISFWRFNKSIYLCNNFFESLDEKSQAGVLIHEVSHFCGAKDGEYIVWNGEQYGDMDYMHEVTIRKRRLGGRKVEKLKKKKVVSPYYSADYYEVWITSGFCLPGFDCESKR